MVNSPTASAEVILHPGRERSLLRGHPWIFSGAIRTVTGAPAPGATVEVRTDGGDFLARGAWSPSSQIRVRVWTFDEQEAVDEAMFRRRIADAVALREELGITRATNASRLVYSEADWLPGLTVDRYGEFLVCQFLSAGAEQWKPVILDTLAGLDGIRGIYERSDAAVRAKEGFKSASGPLRGDEPPPLVAIREQEREFLVDLRAGHKTGFYLDQRDNRSLVARYCREAEVLNCFSYTGGFGIAALRGGARRVVNVDDSAALLELARRNLERNGFEPDCYENLKADVFQQLRRYAEAGQGFDCVILDPPRFAESQKSLNRAARGYKDINRLAFTLLRPGGLLFTFSCSGLVSPELFRKIVADAALEADADAQLLQSLGQAPDHPVKLHIPETGYLKGLVVRAAG